MLAAAIVKGGGEGEAVVPQGSDTRALVWNRFHNTQALVAALKAMPALEWGQFPSTGIDDFVAADVLDPAYTWTNAKGAYSAPVAEHALTLTLALLQQIHGRVRHFVEQAGR